MARATENRKRIHLRTSHKIALAVVGALSALVSLFNPAATADRGMPVFQYRLDLDVYRVGAQRVLDGLELYSGHFPIVADIKLPFTYPPISALLFTPLTALPYTASSVLLTLATITLTWWLLAWTLHSAARLDRHSAGWIAVGLAAVLIHLSPIHTSVTYGQINVLLMAMVFADAFVVPRRFRGLLTALAVSIKLTPAVFGLWFLLRKDWGSVIRMGMGTVGATALAWLILPRDSVRYWTETLRETGRIGGEEYALNQSLNGLLYRLRLRARVTEGAGAGEGSSAGDGGGVGDQIGKALTTANDAHGTFGAHLWLVLVILALIVVALVMLRLLRAEAPIVALCVNALFALLASPVSWSHHWCWAPIMLVAIGSYAFANQRNQRPQKRLPVDSHVPAGHSTSTRSTTNRVPAGHPTSRRSTTNRVPAGHPTSTRSATGSAPAAQIPGSNSTGQTHVGDPRSDRALSGPRWMWIALLIAGFAAFALEPTTFVPYNDQRELHWNLWQQLVGNAYLWWALVALVMLGICARPARSR